MLVSWNWLKEYIPLTMSHEELATRLMMAGLNHESTTKVGDDICIDLEVTSNRPDCLGHIGIAREVGVLWQTPISVPDPAPKSGSAKVADLAKVTLESPQLCYRYTARVIRGVKIKPSPQWLLDRLATVGQKGVNNVVDVTNYVLMECGQPLHAFDLAQLKGRQIIVREAKAGETFQAIDHKTYQLDAGTCVIADAERPVALGGVMGGADSEVSGTTTELLIEAADFAPLSIRSTARKLKLHSPSSYRFERGVDPAGIDWASRRCCELILDLAGGELAEGVIAVGQGIPIRPSITLRLSQIPRVLGIAIPVEAVDRILRDLGCKQTEDNLATPAFIPPSWRRDLTREIDLIEEVARIYGYDQIPEDARVPMAASYRSDADRVLAKTRQIVTAAGFDEAMTASVVSEKWASAFSPWSKEQPLVAGTPMLKGADRLRRSLIPSLLEARRINESVANAVCELFETARIYLPQGEKLPHEQWTLGLVSGGDFLRLKGLAETLVAAFHPAATLELLDARQELLDNSQATELKLHGRTLGYLGALSASGLKQFGLKSAACVMELSLDVLAKDAVLIRQAQKQSPFPAIARDLNLIVAETLRWADLAGTVRAAAGKQLESLKYLDTYRDPNKDGAGKKRLLFSFSLRSQDRTLTAEEADAVRDAVVAACHQQHAAVLLA
jgi:phenylalanyl-tRNA synthetase beta chain